MDLVSIIMPAHNAEKYLEDSIKSVLRQTYQNWELLIINDGSTDQTQNIAERFSKFDERIRVLNQENGRIGAARNAGIKASIGNWIAFLDSDDLWCPDKIDKQIIVSRNYPFADVIFTDGWIFTENNLDKLSHYNSHLHALKEYFNPIGSFTADEMYKMEYTFNYIAVLSVIIKKEVVLKTGFQEENKYMHGCEDLDYWLQLARNGANFYGMEEKLFFYRKHNSNMSGNSTKMLLAQTLVLIKNFRPDYFTKGETIKIFRALINPLIFQLIHQNKKSELSYLLQQIRQTKLPFPYKIIEILLKFLGSRATIPIKINNRLSFLYYRIRYSNIV